ncbi:hypothetical protein [Pedobacter mendelii]|uniref:Uncharacterized protein n=1 Tax=Pedobacter mendelii TaxID=1908240 RepID=A0ABQ2BGL9_9SPHI|nr:hypothetical protein [Pedobacter mendelii]GGI24497.1 hypothetical protein GCM10008119_12950 [Pedobacter mendelii]
MLRKGIVTLIKEDGSGIITDENDQEIPFKFEKDFLKDFTGATVSFRIDLGNKGLVAVGVQLMSDSL